jgi:hypothetical protein
MYVAKSRSNRISNPEQTLRFDEPAPEVTLAALIECIADGLPNRDADVMKLREHPETTENNAGPLGKSARAQPRERR